MRELDVFRWASHLVVGLVLVGGLAALFVPSATLARAVTAQELPELVVSLGVLAIPTYLLGSLIRDAGQALRRVTLFAFFWSEDPRTVHGHRHSIVQNRWRIFDQDDRSTEVGPVPHSAREETSCGDATDEERLEACFHKLLFEVVGELGEPVGPRVMAEWEHLGMLAGLALTWWILLVAVPLAATLQAGRGEGWDAALSTPGHYVAAAGVIALLYCLTGVGYRYRNRVLAEDVAAGSVVLRERRERTGRGASPG